MINLNRSQGLSKVFFRVRSRILTGYIIVIALFSVSPIVGVRQVLLTRIAAAAEKDISHEIVELQQLAKGLNPKTAKPFGNDVSAIFDVFLSRNVARKNQFFITFLNGKFYKASSRDLPQSLQPNSDAVKSWAYITAPEKGRDIDKGNIILYQCEPIKSSDTFELGTFTQKTLGVLVVAQIVAAENEDVTKITGVIVQVMFFIFVIAVIGAAIAWVAAGKVLAPLRLITKTARLITESDLSQRIVVTGSDEIAEVANTFNQMLDRLDAAFASQRDFINDASHELRTPITIIRGYLELLGDDPKERQETIEIVNDELERMSRFIDDLLLLAKAEQPNFLNLDIVDLNSLTAETYAKVKALAVRDWQLDQKEVGCIMADRHRLTQAILNLAQNATQYTQQNDVIAIGSEIRDNNVCFWVRDTGEGINLADQERIFQRFARASNSYRRSEGAGLGLAIVKAIAQAHGGHIELVSRPGAGSTFTIVIPLKIPAQVLAYETNFNCRR